MRMPKIAEVLPIGLIGLNAGGEVNWYNSAAQKLLNLNSDCHLAQCFPEFSFQSWCQTLTQKETKNCQRPSGQHLVLNLIPSKTGNFLLIITDETHLHHLEVMRQDFVANVSHELRTPLTVIHGYLEVLLDRSDTEPVVFQNSLKTMYEQTLRMQHLIEDLLLLSRLEGDSPSEEQMSIISVAALLKQICIDANALSAEKQHHIILECEAHLNLRGIETEIRNAFSNLIFNAVHYTPAQGQIHVRWFSQKGFAILEVEDTGIGIAPEHITRVTERFYRVDHARSRESGGTGLGLAIVKHALIRHQASLEIESTLGKGSVFRCTFDVDKKHHHCDITANIASAKTNKAGPI